MHHRCGDAKTPPSALQYPSCRRSPPGNRRNPDRNLYRIMIPHCNPRQESGRFPIPRFPVPPVPPTLLRRMDIKTGPYDVYSPYALCRNPHCPHSYPQKGRTKSRFFRDFQGFSTVSRKCIKFIHRLWSISVIFLSDSRFNCDIFPLRSSNLRHITLRLPLTRASFPRFSLCNSQSALWLLHNYFIYMTFLIIPAISRRFHRPITNSSEPC